MTPTEVEALDDETYSTFVTYMAREAFEIEKATKARR
jgi:hypothetical protein